MRHQHAGLAITDFPLAYGRLWPDTSPDAIAHYNATRPPGTIGNPITAFQVDLQMAHRLVAYAIFLGVAAAAMLARKKLGGGDALARLAWVWLGLLTLQIFLGAATIWSNKAADVATVHVMVGALALLTGALWCLVAARAARQAHEQCLLCARRCARGQGQRPVCAHRPPLRPHQRSPEFRAAPALEAPRGGFGAGGARRPRAGSVLRHGRPRLRAGAPRRGRDRPGFQPANAGSRRRQSEAEERRVRRSEVRGRIPRSALRAPNSALRPGRRAGSCRLRKTLSTS